ncbi:MAG: OmpA family protein [Burkholderiales bacterium]
MRWMTAKRTALIALCVVIALGGACSTKKKGAGDDGTGVGEEGLGGSSLDRARTGRGPEEDGLLKDIHFGYDSAEVDSGERSRIEQNAEWLRDNPRAKIELEGHCDSRGTIEYNLGLGAKRAKAVKDALVGQGVGVERISTISYGKELPLCQEETDACWARNRRVHAVILGK